MTEDSDFLRYVWEFASLGGTIMFGTKDYSNEVVMALAHDRDDGLRISTAHRFVQELPIDSIIFAIQDHILRTNH